MIKLILVEDQAMVRGALAALLNMEPDIEVIAEFDRAQSAIDYLQTTPADVLLTDIEMPEMSGIELCEYLQEQNINIKLAIVTTFSKSGYIKRALTASVDAFLLKASPSEQLAEAMRAIVAGKKVFDPELALLALGDVDPLTKKERQALKLAAEGKTTGDIATRLFLSEGTVRNYLSEAIAKLNATNRIDAARIAQQKGWL